MAYNGLLRRASSEDEYATLVRVDLRPRASPVPSAAAAAAPSQQRPAAVQAHAASDAPLSGAIGFSSKDDPLGILHGKRPGSLLHAKEGLGSNLVGAPGSMEVLHDTALHALNHIYDAVDLAKHPPACAKAVMAASKVNGVTALVASPRSAAGVVTAPKLVGSKRSFRKAAAARLALQQQGR